MTAETGIVLDILPVLNLPPDASDVHVLKEVSRAALEVLTFASGYRIKEPSHPNSLVVELSFADSEAEIREKWRDFVPEIRTFSSVCRSMVVTAFSPCRVMTDAQADHSFRTLKAADSYLLLVRPSVRFWAYRGACILYDVASATGGETPKDYLDFFMGLSMLAICRAFASSYDTRPAADPYVGYCPRCRVIFAKRRTNQDYCSATCASAVRVKRQNERKKALGK